jgi:hypothetical protein
MSDASGSNERIQRRPPPYFEETDSGLVSGMLSDGNLLDVALNDTNQYGPHAMIVVLGIVATITGVLLGIAMIIF